jgi:hypothetical protein
MQINPIRLGIIIGLVVGLMHACWAGLVASGFAQKLMDFIFWAHFIAPRFQVAPFEITRAAILVGVTFAIGLAVGIVGGILWNMFMRTEGSK